MAQAQEVKLSAKLPKGDENGLNPYSGLLVQHPDRMVVLVGIAAVSQTLVDHAKNTAQPTIEFSTVEIATDAHDIVALRDILDRLAKRRTPGAPPATSPIPEMFE